MSHAAPADPDILVRQLVQRFPAVAQSPRVMDAVVAEAEVQGVLPVYCTHHGGSAHAERAHYAHDAERCMHRVIRAYADSPWVARGSTPALWWTP